MNAMDAEAVSLLREALDSTEWPDRARALGRAMRTTRSPGGLLIAGTPDDEPWHLTAHLADEARLSGLTQLTPTLVRWSPDLTAPPHLRVGVDRLSAARRGETLVVVSENEAPVPLLERVSDARKTGATILAIDGGDPELAALAHDAFAVPRLTAPLTFDGAQHLVSMAAGEAPKKGLRERLARLADRISGPRVPD